MNDLFQLFMDAWRDLVGEYGITQYPYWNERDVVASMSCFLKKRLHEQWQDELELHLDVTLSPTSWKNCALLNKNKEIISRLCRSGGQKRVSWPFLDIAILNADKVENKGEAMNLVAEIKFSGRDVVGKNITSRWKREFQRDICRLRYLVKSRVCEKAAFCYLDEYHDPKNAVLMERMIKEECQNLVSDFYYPYNTCLNKRHQSPDL